MVLNTFPFEIPVFFHLYLTDYPSIFRVAPISLFEALSHQYMVKCVSTLCATNGRLIYIVSIAPAFVTNRDRSIDAVT